MLSSTTTAWEAWEARNGASHRQRHSHSHSHSHPHKSKGNAEQRAPAPTPRGRHEPSKSRHRPRPSALLQVKHYQRHNPADEPTLSPRKPQPSSWKASRQSAAGTVTSPSLDESPRSGQAQTTPTPTPTPTTTATPMRHIDPVWLAAKGAQRASALKLQRSMRRWMNRTFMRDDAARRIQSFVRQFVLSTRRQPQMTTTSPSSLAPPPPLPLTLRMPAMQPGCSRHGHDEDDHEDDEDEFRLRATDSTAPLTDSGLSDWRDSSVDAAVALALQTSDGASDRASLLSVSTVQSSTSSRPALAPYQVVLWFGAQLGLEWSPCPVTGLPFVASRDEANEFLPGIVHVREGDLLVAINTQSAHEDNYSMAQVQQILQSGVRPVMLHMRHPEPKELRARRRHANQQAAAVAALPQAQRPQRHHPPQHPPPPQRRAPSVGAMNRSTRTMARVRQQQRRERIEAALCYVIWQEEDGPLGLRFEQQPGNTYPCVSEVRAHGVAARPGTGLSSPVNIGDQLLRINQKDVSAMGFRMLLQVLHYAPRPLVLTFKCPPRGQRMQEL